MKLLTNTGAVNCVLLVESNGKGETLYPHFEIGLVEGV